MSFIPNTFDDIFDFSRKEWNILNDKVLNMQLTLIFDKNKLSQQKRSLDIWKKISNMDPELNKDCSKYICHCELGYCGELGEEFFMDIVLDAATLTIENIIFKKILSCNVFDDYENEDQICRINGKKICDGLCSCIVIYYNYAMDKIEMSGERERGHIKIPFDNAIRIYNLDFFEYVDHIKKLELFVRK